MAAINSNEGPFGRGLRRRLGEKSSLYFRFTSARLNLRIVAGYITMAERSRRVGCMKPAHISAMARSISLRIGVRCLERLRIKELILEYGRFSNDRAYAAVTITFRIVARNRIQKMEKSRISITQRSAAV
jgi:hypothetical protein